MSRNNQDAVCAFVREIIESRTDEAIEVTDRPDVLERSVASVDELWESPTRRYAVEHTRLESYGQQIAYEERLRRLVGPLTALLAGKLPGTFVLGVRVREAMQGAIRYAEAHDELRRLVIEAAPMLNVAERVLLRSTKLPFAVGLERRSTSGSRLVLRCVIEGDEDAMRLERMGRALADKCPKLKAESADGRTTILALEADDIQLSNFSLAYQAFERAVAERDDHPDIVVFIETDISPMHGWIFKEGDLMGDAVPTMDGHHGYVEGQVPRPAMTSRRPQP